MKISKKLHDINSNVAMRDIKANKIIIKIGTNTLTQDKGNLFFDFVRKLAKVVCELKKQGKQIIIVSSGAIGVGMSKLGFEKRPKEIAEKQACASVGQSLLMCAYDKHFSKHGVAVGQLLLTKDCVTDTTKRTNAVNTFNTLLKMGVVPIVNENDSVAVDEIKFGDNDTLSAHVANLVGADLLILLTDVDGLYDENEYNDLILAVKVVDGIDSAIEHINKYGSNHSECIVTSNYDNANKFQDMVDSACVYVNASTRFSDGFEFGFGAEIGISTQKLHARGAMGLRELTTTKYVINGNGQIRG